MCCCLQVLRGEALTARFMIDGPLMEVFVQHGRIAASLRYINSPEPPQMNASVSASLLRLFNLALFYSHVAPFNFAQFSLHSSGGACAEPRGEQAGRTDSVGLQNGLRLGIMKPSCPCLP